MVFRTKDRDKKGEEHLIQVFQALEIRLKVT